MILRLHNLNHADIRVRSNGANLLVQGHSEHQLNLASMCGTGTCNNKILLIRPQLSTML